jgi:hypothetical protein
VNNYFKPELLNRLSHIVTFDPLSHDQLMEVVKIQMKTAIDRVAKKGITLSASDSALEIILSESYNPVCICYFLEYQMMIRVTGYIFSKLFMRSNYACFFF